MLFHSLVNFTTPNLAGGIKIGAPATGQVVNIEILPGTNHFYQDIGDGVAIKLESQQVNSPIAGTVIDVVASHGKVIIQAKNKLQFLIQFPFDYIEYHGLGINLFVTKGQQVNINQTLFNVDLYKMQQRIKPVHLFFILLTTSPFKSIDVFHKHVQIGKDPIFSLIPKPIKKK